MFVAAGIAGAVAWGSRAKGREDPARAEERLRREGARRAKIRPLEELIRETRTFFNVPGIDMRRKLEAGAAADPLALLAARAWVATVADRREERVRLTDEGIAKFGTEPRTEEFWFLRSWIQQGEERIRLLDTAIGRRPHYPWALFLRAPARAGLGDPAGAERDLTTALAILRGSEIVRRERALARLRLRTWDDCLRDLERVADSPDVWNNRAVAWQGKGDRTRSREAFDRALAIQPDHPTSLRNRGNLRRILRDFAGAIADFDRAIRIDREDAQAWLGRAVTKVEQGDLDGARQDYHAALAKAPPDWEHRAAAKKALRRLLD